MHHGATASRGNTRKSASFFGSAGPGGAPPVGAAASLRPAIELGPSQQLAVVGRQIEDRVELAQPAMDVGETDAHIAEEYFLNADARGGEIVPRHLADHDDDIHVAQQEYLSVLEAAFKRRQLRQRGRKVIARSLGGGQLGNVKMRGQIPGRLVAEFFEVGQKPRVLIGHKSCCAGPFADTVRIVRAPILM